MNNRIKKGIAIVSVFACVAGMAWGETKRMKITVANYQMEPTPADAEMLKYYGDKFGVDFEVINIDNDKYHEILNLKLAAGEIPDLFYLKQADTLGSYVKQGVVAKMDLKQIQKNAPDLVKALDTYAPGYMDMGRVKGVQYAIPAVNPTNIYHIPLVYRADWMKKVGVTKTPTTLAEFEDLMIKFTRNDPDGNGKNDTYGLSMDGFNAVFGAFGVVPFDHSSKGGPGTDYWMLEKGKVVNHSISAGTKEALTLLSKWYKDGLIDPEFITGENQGGYWALSHSFIKGRIGFSTRGNYYHWALPGLFQLVDENGMKQPNQPGAIAKEFLAINPAGSLAFGQSLKGPTGKQGIKAYNRLMNFFCIGRTAGKDPAKVAKIYQILNESASSDFVVRNTVHYGTIDKFWKLLDLDTETVAFIPPYDKQTSYFSRIGAELWITMPFPPKDPIVQWAASLGYDKMSIESLIQVGMPMAMKYKSELMKMRDEVYIAMITGAKPVGYYEEFVQKYLAAGGEQAQIEANDYYKEMNEK